MKNKKLAPLAQRYLKEEIERLKTLHLDDKLRGDTNKKRAMR